MATSIVRHATRGIYLSKKNRGSTFRKWKFYQPCQLNFRLNSNFVSKGTQIPNNAKISFLRSRWFQVPASVGVGYICYRHYKTGYVGENEFYPAKEWQIDLYRMMPLRAMSRLWGKMNEVELPLWLRKPLLNLYVWWFNCNLQEAAIENLSNYLSLGDFFRRKLKPTARIVDPIHPFVSPCDGKIICFGQVHNSWLEQIKSVTFSLFTFFGPNTWNTNKKILEVTDDEFHQSLSHSSDSKLYYCTIYLAPGDYHGFHSPVDWVVNYRRHFAGDLLSVNPKYCRKIPGLFNYNERAIYFGQWKYGFFSMAAVGATNVGSIRIYFDKMLKTNSKKWKCGNFDDFSFKQNTGFGTVMKKGESFGEFNLGSTIMLIFEAPRNFEFKTACGESVKMGEALGLVK